MMMSSRYAIVNSLNLEEPLKLIAENKQVLGLDQKALLQIDIYQRGVTKAVLALEPLDKPM